MEDKPVESMEPELIDVSKWSHYFSGALKFIVPQVAHNFLSVDIPNVASLLKSTIWEGVERIISKSFIDINWVRNALFPCFYSLFWKLVPVAIVSNIVYYCR